MKKLSVCIVDYGIGNTQSVSNALVYLGYNVAIGHNHNLIRNSDALVLPGVGAFDTAMKNLKKLDLHHLLHELVITKQKPILGICLGMQVMASFSFENGEHKGLSWIKGEVIKINEKIGIPVPHVGWNEVFFKNDSLSSPNMGDRPHFYFDHSYHFIVEEPQFISGQVDYGGLLTAAITNKNIYGVQFHPEKSQINGLRVFKSFMNMVKQYA